MKEQTAGSKRFRFNVIDVLVLLVLAAVVFIIVTKAGAAKQQAAASSSAETAAAVSLQPGDITPNVRFEVLAENVRKDAAASILAGVQQANRINNNYRLLSAYISAEPVIEPCYVYAVGADGALQSAEDPDHVNLRFTVDAYISKSDYYTSVDGNFSLCLGSQDLRLGKSYTLKTMTIELATTIVALEELQ